MSRSKRLLLAALGVLCTASLVSISIWRHGTPLNLYTWIACSICAISGATLALNGKRVWFLLLLLFCVYAAVPSPFLIILPLENSWLFDNARGGYGYEVTPGMRFRHEGANTALLESYIGPIEPEWRHAAPHSPHVRDGNERVQKINVIQRAYLPALLNMLPDDDARRTVIRTLTDTENRLRVHQSLLLSALYHFKYPPGTNRESWWAHHKEFFRPEHDSFLAASLTQDWAEKIAMIHSDGEYPREVARQLSATRYQQQGTWGGHEDFGEAFRSIEYGERQPDPGAREQAEKIIWWPEL